MNKAIRITALIGLLFFLASHYLVVSVHKEHFPIFAYLYPFVAKFWFETGRFFLMINWPIDLEYLFGFIKYLLLFNIAIVIFAFKSQWFYIMTLWLDLIIFACYSFAIIFLGLATIYPIYTLYILASFFVCLSLIKSLKL